jgi:hypothetical protein
LRGHGFSPSTHGESRHAPMREVRATTHLAEQGGLAKRLENES